MTNRVTPRSDVLFRELDGESVLLNMGTGKYFGLDPVGTRMWQVLVEVQDVDTTCSRLLEEYEVDETRLREDLQKLIHELAEHQLIEIQ